MVSPLKALLCAKCRDHLVWLGRVAGYEQILKFYDFKRASGRKLNGISAR